MHPRTKTPIPEEVQEAITLTITVLACEEEEVAGAKIAEAALGTGAAEGVVSATAADGKPLAEEVVVVVVVAAAQAPLATAAAEDGG